MRSSGYPDRTVKQEVAANAAARLRSGQPLVEGLVGFDETVLPALETALADVQTRKAAWTLSRFAGNHVLAGSSPRLAN